jgi:hypothetical protein
MMSLDCRIVSLRPEEIRVSAFLVTAHRAGDNSR